MSRSTIIFIGPVSDEVLEAAHAVRHPRVLLCCSPGQVGPNAYTGLTRERFKEKLTEYEFKYGWRVRAERDHALRPDSGVDDWDGFIDDDIACGCFSGIHLHTFELDDALIERCKRYRRHFDWIQLGPGEDRARPIDQKLIDFAGENSKCTWLSCDWGYRVADAWNPGLLRHDVYDSVKERWPDLRLRAHNCDFLTLADRNFAHKHFNGLNFAPMLAAIQSTVYLQYSFECGYNVTQWIHDCSKDYRNQGRWGANPYNWLPCLGHYHYDSIAEFRNRCRDRVVNALCRAIESLL